MYAKIINVTVNLSIIKYPLLIALLGISTPLQAMQIAYSYDSLNRLVSADYGNGTVISYSYDATGNRLTKIARNPNPVAIDDADGDGIPNVWELDNGLSPNNPADALSDLDNDGLNALAEYQNGTKPNNPDTDGDGVSDYVEVMAKSNPLDPNSVPVTTTTPPPATEQPHAIPTLSEWGIIALMCLMVISGVKRLRKRKQTL